MDTARLVERPRRLVSLRHVLVPLVVLAGLGTGVAFLWVKTGPVVLECEFPDRTITVSYFRIRASEVTVRTVFGKTDGRRDDRWMLCVLLSVTNTHPDWVREW